jgi:hypothetical protein
MHRFPGVRLMLLILVGSSGLYPKALSEQSLRIRIYDLAGVPTRTLDHAIQDASQILSTADVNASWERGSDAEEAHTNDLSKPAVKRFAQDYRGYIVVSISRGFPTWFHAGALGYALPEAPSGVNVTIFYDRVERLNTPDVVDVARVLGRVIAHEIGHVLLGSTEHCGHGIMRAIRRKEDFQISGHAAEFTAEQRALIHRRFVTEEARDAHN